VLLRLFGQNGDRIMQAMKDAAEKYDSTATAKQLKVDLLKLLLKVLLLYREKIITPEAIQPAKQPLLLMMDLLIETLEADRSKRNPAELARAMAESHDAAMPLLKPNVREHNWVRLTRVFDFYGNEEFLAAFLLDEAYTDMRNSILINFQILLKRYELEGQIAETKNFLRGQALERRAQLEGMVQNPTLREWLENEQTSTLFSDWLRVAMGPEALNLQKFVKQVSYYRSTNNRSLLPKRAEQVYETYLVDGAQYAIATSAEVRAAVDAKYGGGGKSAQRTDFDAAEAEAKASLNDMFLGSFIGSEQFQVIVDEITEIDRRMNRQDQLNAALQEAATVPDGDIKDLALDVNVTKGEGSGAAEETGHDSEDDSNDLLNMGGGSDTPPPPPSGGGLGAAEEKSA